MISAFGFKQQEGKNSGAMIVGNIETNVRIFILDACVY